MIPIIGKGLNYLFGTATESDLNTICSSFSRLAKSQEMIANAVDENISLINITRVEMSENRQALNKIIGILANLYVKLGNVATSIRKRGVSGCTICTIIFTIRFYFTGNKKNSFSN